MNRYGLRLSALGSLFAFAPMHAQVVVAGTEPDAIFADGFELPTLTVNNVDAWCTVTINGGVPSSAAQTVTSFARGAVVTLHGDPINSTFVWGYWNGTDAGGTDHNANAAVTMNGDKTVLACCPFSGQTTCP